MKTISAEQLGNFAPYRTVGSWRKSEAIEPIPIVQWRNDEVAMAFYYEWTWGSILGHYKQNIVPVKASGPHGVKALGSDYPIHFSAKAEDSRGERGMAAFDIDHHVAIDLTGDGVDELILPRHQGAIDVYGSQGKIASWTAPNRAEAYYANDAVLVHTAKNDGRYLVYYVYRSEPFSGVEIPEAIAKTHAASPAELIVEVSITGCRTIPLLGLPGRLAKVLGLAYWNPPGKTPELVVLSQIEGSSETLLSRHGFDGAIHGAARPVYVKLGYEPRMEFVPFQPGDASLVAVGTDTNLVAYVWPEKEVNWFKTVKFGDDWRAELGHEDPLLFRGLVDRASQRAKVLFQQGRKLFVRDDDGLCYRKDGTRYTAMPEGKIVPWQEVPATSPYHRLAQIRLLEGDDDAVLVLEVRKAGKKDLSLDEVREAAKKFLPPEFSVKTEQEHGLTFERLMERKELLPRSLRDTDAAAALRTMEDVKRLAPEYWEFHSASILSHLALRYETELLAPLQDYQPAPLEGPRYHNIPEFKEWLLSIHFDASVRLRVLGRTGGLADHILEPGTIYTTSEAPGIPARWVVTKRTANGLSVVLPMILENKRGSVKGIFQLKLK